MLAALHVHNEQFNGIGQKRYEVDLETGCWVWLLSTSHGYPYMGIQVDGRPKRVRAHRWFYERFVGPVPDGHHVHHRCENPLCVNPHPDHLGAKEGRLHLRDHKKGKKMNLSDAEVARRQEHGRVMGRANIGVVYTKTTRSEASKKAWETRRALC